MTGGAAPAVPARSLVVGGHGAVGRLFVEQLRRSGSAVVVVDPAPAPAGEPPERYLPADVRDIDPALAAELGRADLVVLAVAERVALAGLGPVTAAMRPGTLLVHTLSSQHRMAAAVAATPARTEVLGLNPMFAPALGFAGRPVAAIALRPGPGSRQFRRLLASWGARVVELSADGHERITAATQALTHAVILAFGLALDDLDVDVAELAAVAPPPHATLLGLLARIAAGNPEVYWDVQAGRPPAAAARGALVAAAARLDELADAGDEDGFGRVVDRIRARLGPELDRQAAACARRFAAVPST